MIVKNIIDFSRISYEGNKAANAGHAAYWLAAQHDEDLSGALRVQEDAIIEGFTHMAAMLGYRIEKIDADPAETVAKFGHHPEPATDFCVEVEAIEGEWFNVQMGFENGTPSKDELMKRVDAAMSFRVGGDLNAIKAKALLREIDKGMKTGPSSAPRDTPSIRPGLSDAGVPTHG